MHRNLPSVSEDEVSVWDDERNRCGGYLSKKASQTSAFSRGKWQKRYFEIKLEIDASENYKLEYFHTPEEKKASSSYPLSGASIKMAGETNFTITLHDGSAVSLNADSPSTLKQWVQTLEKVIAVSNLRERLLGQRRASHDDDDEEDYDANEAGDDLAALDGHFRKARRNNKDGVVRSAGFTSPGKRKWPTLRLDFDISSIPSGSPERLEFEEELARDLAAALTIEPDNIEIISVRPCPGMEWLCLLEFDFHVRGEEWEAASTGSVLSSSDVKRRLLESLVDMIRDSSSSIYRGYITSRVDPSYVDHLLPNRSVVSPGGKLQQSSTTANTETEFFSTSAIVLQTMLKYKDTYVPPDFENLTHFNITVVYDGRAVSLAVPNPAVLRPVSACYLWPFEVKQALGFMHTMQELWVEPKELVPRDAATKSESRPIPFSPSHRVNNLPVINALLLKPDTVYDLHCEDKRDEAVSALSPEEMESIKETFHRFDRNQDGGISKEEMKLIVRERSGERKAQIEKKFQKFLAENPELTPEEIAATEANKARYLQQVSEAQTRLAQMFEAADLDGDGTITITEFILAEAWWQRCTINPDRAHLF